jgi:acyl-CoA thioesterase I
MSPIFSWFLSGVGYASICALGLVLVIFGWRLRSKRSGRFLAASGLLLLLVAGFAASVVPVWMHAAGCAALVLVLLLQLVGRFDRATLALLCAGSGVILIGIGLEIRNAFGLRPSETGVGVVVVGDSLSAGIRPNEITWPAKLAALRGVSVRNLSIPGAKVAQGLRLIGHENVRGSVVIILLGGNDMFSKSDPAVFERELDALVRLAKEKGGVPLLVQFPALPTQGAFPASVARVARSEQVGFIPRWVLSGVLARKGSTVDGLHLSPDGHDALAKAISAWVQLGTPPHTTGS